MVSLQLLQNELLRFIGAKIRSVGLWVLPFAVPLSESDVVLCLECVLPTGEVRQVQFGTMGDGQSPGVDFATIPDGIPITELDEKQRLWASEWQESQSEGYARALFVATADTDHELARMCGEAITRIFLIRFADGSNSPTGICVECANGSRAISYPGACGNAVTMHPSKAEWPCPVEFVDI